MDRYKKLKLVFIVSPAILAIKAFSSKTHEVSSLPKNCFEF